MVYRQVLRCQAPQYMVALPEHNKFIVHTEGKVTSYSLDLLARLSQGNTTEQALEASSEKISSQDNVTVARVGYVKGRAIGEHAFRMHFA